MRYRDLVENQTREDKSDYYEALRKIRYEPSLIANYYQYGEEICELAVQTNGLVLSMIPNPSERVIDLAIQDNPNAIKFVKDPTVGQQCSAVCRYPTTIEYIRNPCIQAVAYLIDTRGPDGLRLVNGELTEEMVKYALKNNARKAIALFSNLPPELQNYAFVCDPYSIKALRNLSNFDPAVDERFQQFQRKQNHAHRQLQRLPSLGDRRHLGNLNQDQLKILRWMELNNTDTMSVRQLKSQTWGNNPFMQSLVKYTGGKDITRDAVIAQPSNRQLVPIMQNCRVTAGQWAYDDQKIFGRRKNNIAIYSQSGDQLSDLITDERDITVMNHVLNNSLHPKATPDINWKAKTSTGLNISPILEKPKLHSDTRYTIGWVRYTVFGKDIWIDEVQSDLPKFLSPEANLKFKGIQDAILVDFIGRMRRRGAQRFYMPTIEMKRDPNLYAADPPMSVYTDLPKKMRMHKAVVTGVDSVVDGQTAWLLESR